MPVKANLDLIFVGLEKLFPLPYCVYLGDIPLDMHLYLSLKVALGRLFWRSYIWLILVKQGLATT